MPIGPLDGTTDDMGEGSFGDLSGELARLAGPVAEAGAKAVNRELAKVHALQHCRKAHVAQGAARA